MTVSALLQQLRTQTAQVGDGQSGPVLRALVLLARLYLAAALAVALIFGVAVAGVALMIGWLDRILSLGVGFGAAVMAPAPAVSRRRGPSSPR